MKMSTIHIIHHCQYNNRLTYTTDLQVTLDIILKIHIFCLENKSLVNLVSGAYHSQDKPQD